MQRGPVLCPVDFSPLSQRSLRLAIEMCRRTGARLVLEHNLDSPPPSYLGVGWMWSGEHASKDRDAAQRAVERLQQLFAEIPDDVEYEAKLTRGPVDEGVLYLARELGAGMIVIGTHGPSGGEHKSVTERLILQAPCSVLTTGEGYEPATVFGATGEPPERLSVLVPVDFSARSLACARFAMELARRMPHQIHLLHVLPSGGSSRRLAQRAGDLDDVKARLAELVPEDLAKRVAVRVLVGESVPSILEAAQATKALFIMMPAHRQGAIRRWVFGTTTLGVLHGSDCPVWFLSPRARRALVS